VAVIRVNNERMRQDLGRSEPALSVHGEHALNQLKEGSDLSIRLIIASVSEDDVRQRVGAEEWVGDFNRAVATRGAGVLAVGREAKYRCGLRAQFPESLADGAVAVAGRIWRNVAAATVGKTA
jgi:hypothetical protein